MSKNKSSADLAAHSETEVKSRPATCSAQHHPSHKADLSRLKRIVGQLNGIERMINEGRYCPDILMQTRAVSAAVRALEASLLERHIKHCVQEAFSSDNLEERDAKVSELIKIFNKRLDR